MSQDDGRDAEANNPRLRDSTRHNDHPTVKPVELMRWLIRLLRPPGATLGVDPFAGSGSTLVAAALEGAPFVGVEREERYVEIARARVAAAREGNESEGRT